VLHTAHKLEKCIDDIRLLKTTDLLWFASDALVRMPFDMDSIRVNVYKALERVVVVANDWNLLSWEI
jgi:hypothetical protein